MSLFLLGCDKRCELQIRRLQRFTELDAHEGSECLLKNRRIKVLSSFTSCKDQSTLATTYLLPRISPLFVRLYPRFEE